MLSLHVALPFCVLADVRVLLAYISVKATRDDYTTAIVEDNGMGKPTLKSRELALRHLGVLYGLDLTNPLFRALRRLWSRNEAAQPMLALAVALARDPLLRSTQSFVLKQPHGVSVPRESFESLFTTTFPDRFSPASLRSTSEERRVGKEWVKTLK